jgi:hypothetical protein
MPASSDLLTLELRRYSLSDNESHLIRWICRMNLEKHVKLIACVAKNVT